MSNFDVKILLFITGVEMTPPSEKHETLFKEISLPFAPFPGLTLEFKRNYKDDTEQKTSVEKRVFHVLQLQIGDRDAKYDIDKGRFRIILRLYYQSFEKMDKAIKELISDFDFHS